MLLAAIGDIHGNFPAFDAVMRRIEGTGILTVVNTGDSIVGFPWPNEVIEHLRTRRIRSVQGEMDREALMFQRRGLTSKGQWSDEQLSAIEWSHQYCRSDNLEFLRALPRRKIFAVEGLSVCLCHGTPTGQTDSLAESDPITKFKRQREVANTHIIICGRTHTPFMRFVDDTLFVNPGAVGISEGEPGQARYAVVNTETTPWSVEFVVVKYDPSQRPDSARR